MSVRFSSFSQTPPNSITRNTTQKAPATTLPPMSSMTPQLPDWFQLQQGETTPLGTSAPPKITPPSAESTLSQGPARSGFKSSVDKSADLSGEPRIGTVVNVSAEDVTRTAAFAKGLAPHKASEIDQILERVRKHLRLHPTQDKNIFDSAVQDLRKLMK